MDELRDDLKNSVRFYASEILVALEEIHLHNVIHRDVKPENVMIDNSGHIKLIDFGFSKILEAKKSFKTYTICGTTGYTAPEIL
jgi:serine/threonine protein kinase